MGNLFPDFSGTEREQSVPLEPAVSYQNKVVQLNIVFVPLGCYNLLQTGFCRLSHWALGIQYMNLGGCDTNIQAIAYVHEHASLSILTTPNS